ncbi:MAG: hypothetical protein KDK36_00290 [Leptospiraceae bacterium]|nr:hypothetical protein [Leptospiraceae bacterium]
MNLKIFVLTTLLIFSCNLHNESGIIPELLMLKQNTGKASISGNYSTSSISYTKNLAAKTTPTIS